MFFGFATFLSFLSFAGNDVGRLKENLKTLLLLLPVPYFLKWQMLHTHKDWLWGKIISPSRHNITIRIWNGKRDAINVTKATKATFSCAFIFCSFMSGAMLLKIYMYNYSIDSLLRTTLMTYFMMTQLYSVPDVMRGYLFILHVSVLCCILSNWSISCRVLNHHNDQVLCLHCLTFFPLSLRLRMHQKSKEFFILTLLIISAHNVVVDVVVGH